MDSHGPGFVFCCPSPGHLCLALLLFYVQSILPQSSKEFDVQVSSSSPLATLSAFGGKGVFDAYLLTGRST